MARYKLLGDADKAKEQASALQCFTLVILQLLLCAINDFQQGL